MIGALITAMMENVIQKAVSGMEVTKKFAIAFSEADLDTAPFCGAKAAYSASFSKYYSSTHAT